MAEAKNHEVDNFAQENAYGEGADANNGYDHENFHHASK